jgi:hypothetical protein
MRVPTTSFIGDQYGRILVEEDVRAVRSPDGALGPHDHGLADLALLHATIRDRLFDGDHDDVPDGGKTAARATKDADALELPSARIVGHL